MGLKDWIAGKVETEVAKRLDTPGEVEAMIENAPPLPKPPLGWGDWLLHTVIGGGWTAAVAAIAHQLSDGFQVSDLYVLGGTFLHGAAGAFFVPGDWAKSNKLIVIGLGAVATVIDMMGMRLLSGQIPTEHDLVVAVSNGVAFAATAFQKRPDEKA